MIFEWVKIEAVLDSGAAESVAPSTTASWIPTSESPGSRSGQTYMSASGAKLPNQGEKRLRVTTAEGKSADATFQIADVTRPLSAVSKICDRGNTVVFTSEGGYIQNPEGHLTHFRRENNVYMLDMYLQAPLRPGSNPSDFHRQSR